MSHTSAESGARQAQTGELCCSLIELRQYTMKPGRCDDLIALFEEHFIEGQEAEGMRIIGQFRSRTNPDQFVWMRGFADMEARRKALEGFYSGPIWKEHCAAARDTVIDSDNVLLLKPARAASGFHFDAFDRPTMEAKGPPGGVIIATIYAFSTLVDAKFVDFFETKIVPALDDAGATLLGYFVTEPSENTFPQSPVREGEYIFIWLASFADDAAYEMYQTALPQSQAWIKSLFPALQNWLAKPEEVLELAPTRRSLLHHRPRKQRADTALP